MEKTENKKIIYTIGYTAFPETKGFVEELKKYGINVLIDVRSTPYSQRNPDYNRENLRRVLKENGILYRNYAREFGARQENINFYRDDGNGNQVLDFEVFAKSEQFREGLDKVDKGVELGYTFVLMCAEKDPMTCHRAILVSRGFKEQKGYKVIHLLEGDKTETQENIEDRLLGKSNNADNYSFNYFFDHPDENNSEESLKEDHQEKIIEAYRKQNNKIGYKINDTEEDR